MYLKDLQAENVTKWLPFVTQWILFRLFCHQMITFYFWVQLIDVLLYI